MERLWIEDCGLRIEKTKRGVTKSDSHRGWVSITFLTLTLVLVGLLGAQPAQAATITSAGTGDWEATGTWVGGAVPTSSDSAVVDTGHEVTITGATVAIDGLTVDGTLNQATVESIFSWYRRRGTDPLPGADPSMVEKQRTCVKLGDDAANARAARRRRGASTHETHARARARVHSGS